MLQHHRYVDVAYINNNYINVINSTNKISNWKLTTDRKHIIPKNNRYKMLSFK